MYNDVLDEMDDFDEEDFDEDDDERDDFDEEDEPDEEDFDDDDSEEEDEGEEEQELTDPAGEKNRSPRGNMSADERHANAARRREEERNAEKARNESAIRAANIRNPYRDNAPVTTIEELEQYNADCALHKAWKDVRGEEPTAENLQKLREADPEYRRMRDREADEEIRRQYAEIKRFDPNAKPLGELLSGEKGAEFRAEANRRHDLVKAYKYVYMDEILRDSADAMHKAAGSGKQHLKSTSSRGTGGVTVTEALRKQYRDFDPNVTDEEIARYEAQYRKRAKL